MIKRLDKLMAKSFLGPFVITFAIAIFVLMMQVLWLYLDDIAGKGLGFFTVIELMSYKCVGLVPLALPLALLISSVMVLGGMAEKYELSSFKSAGTSLLRVMGILVIFGVISAAVSFSVADYVIPAANLQFGARMYDIQQKKPTMSMEPGVFNEDFNQFAIRIGHKDDNGRDIADVMIYDHTKASTGELGQITAKRGEMFTTPDGNAFVMKLYDGVQYAEQRPGGGNGNSRPYLRTSFNTYTKVFDLSEFKLGSTNPDLFRTNRSMLATWQLQIAVDSIDKDIAYRKQNISNQLLNYMPLLREDTIVYKPKVRSDEAKLQENYNGRPKMDSTKLAAGIAEGRLDSMGNAVLMNDRSGRGLNASGRVTRTGDGPRPDVTRGLVTREGGTSSKDRQKKRNRILNGAKQHKLVKALDDWRGIDTIMAGMEGSVYTRVMNRTRSATRAVTGQAQAASRILPGIRESRVKHIYDMHMKYSMALVCIIFIFIGAPMGAIVRKGGFGYPILVSIIFFVIFIILTIFCRKLAESFVVDAAFAGWLPCVVLFPVSLYITSRAMKDAKLVSTDSFNKYFGLAKEWVRTRRTKEEAVK